jgi:hypothetical protein
LLAWEKSSQLHAREAHSLRGRNPNSITLYEELRGEARLEPIEPHLTLSFAGDGKGHIEVVGTAQNHLGSGTKLSFWLEADQTYLPAIARAVRAADSTEQI